MLALQGTGRWRPLRSNLGEVTLPPKAHEGRGMQRQKQEVKGQQMLKQKVEDQEVKDQEIKEVRSLNQEVLGHGART